VIADRGALGMRLVFGKANSDRFFTHQSASVFRPRSARLRKRPASLDHLVAIAGQIFSDISAVLSGLIVLRNACSQPSLRLSVLRSICMNQSSTLTATIATIGNVEARNEKHSTHGYPQSSTRHQRGTPLVAGSGVAI
jgi:hypothetical protein